MIPIALEPEPSNFNPDVRQPGLAFLKSNPNPTNKNFNRRRYWKEISQELHNAYDRVCAYTCFFISDGGTVDHFLPKTTNPELAYEWSNYRLASPRANNHKADNVGIIDPFNMVPELFLIEFPSCLIKVNDSFDIGIQQQAENTIDVLRLNDDDHFVQTRCDIMLEYANSGVTLEFLARKYPFLAFEIVRQNIQDTVEAIFKKIV